MTLARNGKWILVGVWLAMIAATIGSVFAGRSTVSLPATAVMVILALAYIKCRLVVYYFMEVGHGPIGWRVAFELWMAVSVLLIAGFRFFH